MGATYSHDNIYPVDPSASPVEGDPESSEADPTARELFDILRDDRTYPPPIQVPGGSGQNWADSWAWYCPLHYYCDQYGIYIENEGIENIAVRMAYFIPLSARPYCATNLSRTLKLLRLAAFHYFYLHERYHHRVEAFSTRLELIERQPRYVPYHETVYRPAVIPLLTDYAIEEGLAVADVWRVNLNEAPYLRGTFLNYVAPNVSVRKLLLKLVEEEIRSGTLPPGYRTAEKFLTRRGFDLLAFDRQQDSLCAMVQQACQVPLSGAADWQLCPGLIVDDYLDVPVYVLARQSPSLPRSPIRKVQGDARKVIRQARQWGIHEAPDRQRRGSGDHVWLSNSEGDTNHIDTGRDSLSSADWRALLDLINKAWDLSLKDNSQGRKVFFDGPGRVGALQRKSTHALL